MNEFCSGKLINRLDHYAGKKGLDIKHLSKATLEKLIDWGWVTKITDLYHLEDHRKEWINKPGFGEKSVDRLILSINEARRTDLASFIAAMGIPLIGKTYAKQLAEIFETYENFRASTTPDPVSGIQPFDFTQIAGFGEAMHLAITSFNYDEFDKLYDIHLIELKNPATVIALFDNANSLEGKTFVITGKLKNYKNRDLLKAEIEAHGGKVVGSVSSKTSYLVNNDINSTSSKNKTAKELGVQIITEEELLSMF
jgi:DNA ligase (NAD+)